MKILANQCKRPSKLVGEKDLSVVIEDSGTMHALCYLPLGKFKSALALAHCQINHENPLRFFVTKQGEIIINPRIVERSGQEISDTEGCMSFPFRGETKVKRSSEITVCFQVLNKNKKLSKPKVKKFEGLEARIFQHEIDHFNGKSIYP